MNVIWTAFAGGFDGMEDTKMRTSALQTDLVQALNKNLSSFARAYSGIENNDPVTTLESSAAPDDHCFDGDMDHDHESDFDRIPHDLRPVPLNDAPLNSLAERMRSLTEMQKSSSFAISERQRSKLSASMATTGPATETVTIPGMSLSEYKVVTPPGTKATREGRYFG